MTSACTTPPPLTDDQLLDLLDDLATPDLRQHIEHCPFCANRLAIIRRVDANLAAALPRWDCPTPTHLGEYHLNRLAPADRKPIAAHLETCLRCQTELDTLATFLASDAPEQAPQPTRTLIGEIVAVFTRPTPQPGFVLRGVHDGPQMAEAPGLTVFLETRIDGHTGHLTGQIIAADPDRWADALAELSQADAIVAVVPLDDLGMFQSPPLPLAPTHLRLITATGQRILIPDIQFNP